MKWYIDRNSYDLVDETQIEKHYQSHYSWYDPSIRPPKEEIYEEVVIAESEDVDD